MIISGYLGLIFFGWLAFFNAVAHPFVHDDIVFILNNPHIADLNHWYEAFRLPAVSDGLNTYYRPALEVLYRLEYHFFGPYPLGFHCVNICVHIINGLLLFNLLEKIGLIKRVAWVIALLFLIHPVQTEAVSCIAGISNLWMALGVLLALHAYVDRKFAASLGCFVLAFLGKEQAVLFLPLVMLIDYSRGQRNYLAWFLWMLVIFALLGLRQSMTGSSLLKDILFSPGELYLRLAAIPRVIGMDLRLIFFPYDLHYYRNTDILQPNTFAWAMALLSLGVIIFSVNRWSQIRWVIILGLGWFLAALLPVLNIAPLINEYSLILTPEHFLYLPMVGILILAVTAADYFIECFKKIILPLPFLYIKSMLGGVVIGACLLMTWHQNTFWRSEIALFERMIEFEGDFARGHLLLAKAYYRNGQPHQAEGHFEKSFNIMSGYEEKAKNLTSKRFYLRYMKEILLIWSQNEYAMGNRAGALDKIRQLERIDPSDSQVLDHLQQWINSSNRK